MNQYLLQLSPEEGLAMYNLLGNLQWPAFAGILLWATIKYPRPIKEKIILWIAFVIARFWGAYMVPLLSKVTHGMIPNANFGIAFGFVVLIMAAIAYCVRVPVLFSLDVAVPAFILGRGLAITGCMFFGCCYGLPVSWGMYSCVAESFTFPTVLMDVVLSCTIVGYLIYLTQKQQYAGNGAAMGMVLFGILRVLVDLLRDNVKLVWRLTAEGFFGIVYLAAGVLLLRAFFIRGGKNEVS